MLDPVYEEVVTGQAEVRSIFKLSKVGTIAGCYVTDGWRSLSSKETGKIGGLVTKKRREMKVAKER